MKILHVSALPVWSMDGKGGMPSLRETLTGHVRGGHTLSLVLPKYDPFSDDAKPLFVPEDQQIEVHFSPCSWMLPFKKIRRAAYKVFRKKNLPFAVRWVLNLLMFTGLTISLTLTCMRVRKDGFVAKLVYAHNQYASMVGFIVARLYKCPNVTRLYGTFLADLMKKPFVSLRYPTAAAGYLVPSDLLICANDGTRGDEVAKKFNIPEERFRFWQNGIDPPSRPPQGSRQFLVSRFPALRIDSNWAVSCSRLATWKRIDRMLEAMVSCKKETIDCQLVIAGDGPQRKSLHSLAEDLGIADYVVWLGAVAHDDIWALMNCADMFLLTNDVTNRCNPLYEAAWAGLPVVSIHDPSTADLLKNRENALLVDKDNPELLGQCIVELCRDDLLKKKLGEAQKELSRSFWTWTERMQAEVMDLEILVAEYDYLKDGSDVN